MAKILQLTENSWIFRAGDANSGILFKTDTGYLFMGPKTRSTYASLDEVKKKYGNIKVVEREETVDNSTLNGYPVKHPVINKVSDMPPIYTKDNGKTEYVAGYWGLLFQQGWTQAFCPKKATIDAYESVGPFKNRLEMLNHLSTLNTNANLKKL
ncbi:hypothetical protein D3C87_583560 [compost metagenome]